MGEHAVGCGWAVNRLLQPDAISEGLLHLSPILNDCFKWSEGDVQFDQDRLVSVEAPAVRAHQAFDPDDKTLS